jgi:hypothetical protein
MFYPYQKLNPSRAAILMWLPSNKIRDRSKKNLVLLMMVSEGNEGCLFLQAPQEELSQVVLSDGSIEKTVRLRALCKVEWFENGQSAIVMPVSTEQNVPYILAPGVVIITSVTRYLHSQTFVKTDFQCW